MGLFDRFRKKPAAVDTPVDVFWMRSSKGAFYNFLNLDPEEKGLKGRSGVFVLWHAGLRPEWLYIGHTPDLAATFEALRVHDEVRDYEGRGGLYITWSEIRPEYQPGIVKYLTQVLKPVIDNPDIIKEDEDEEDVQPIAVFPPGVSAPRR